jgi:hypothetical protein
VKTKLTIETSMGVPVEGLFVRPHGLLGEGARRGVTSGRTSGQDGNARVMTAPLEQWK